MDGPTQIRDDVARRRRDDGDGVARAGAARSRVHTAGVAVARAEASGAHQVRPARPEGAGGDGRPLHPRGPAPRQERAPREAPLARATGTLTMPDMIARLYALPDASRYADRATEAGVTVRRATPADFIPLRAFVDAEFETRWADGVAVAFARQPMT